MCITSKQKEDIELYVAFVKSHVLSEYQVDISGIKYTVVPSIEIPGHGKQPGLFLDNKIASRMVKAKYTLSDDKQVLLSAISNETGFMQYFGIVFHEFGHSTFDQLGKNTEDGAFTVELTALVAYVLENPDKLDVVQNYVEARNQSGMFKIRFSMVKNPIWEVRAKTSLEYLSNKTRSLMAYPSHMSF